MAKNIDYLGDFLIKISPTTILPVHVYSLTGLQSTLSSRIWYESKKDTIFGNPWSVSHTLVTYWLWVNSFNFFLFSWIFIIHKSPTRKQNSSVFEGMKIMPLKHALVDRYMHKHLQDWWDFLHKSVKEQIR